MATSEVDFPPRDSFLKVLVLYRHDSPCHISLSTIVGAISQ